MISGASDHFARFDKLPVMGAILGEQEQGWEDAELKRKGRTVRERSSSRTDNGAELFYIVVYLNP